MTTSSYNIKTCGSYCSDCFADVESECICDRIVGYNAETGFPIVEVTEEEEAYLYNERVSGMYETKNLHNARPEGNDVPLHDIDFVCELGDSKMGEIMRHELSDGYDIPLYEIDRLIN
jgi:hypothetical protein